MNVLFLANWYPTTDSPVNGLFIREHARAASLAGNKVVVLAVNIVNSDLVLQRQIDVLRKDEFGIETHILHIRSRFWKWFYAIPYFTSRTIRRYYHKHVSPTFVPDIIHSNIIYPTGIVGDKLAHKLNVKHVITEHWSGVERFMKKNPFAWLGRKAYKRAKAITVVSHFLEGRVAPYSGDTKIHIVPNIIDDVQFSYAPKNNSGSVNFTAIATWNRYKMPHLFTEALERISKTTSQKLILNFIGEGEYLEEIKQKKWNFTIRYLGNLPKEKVASTLQSSDYFLHASQIETFSIVTAEALLTGTPVIASNVGALPELVNDKNGILTENSVHQWTAAIEKAMQMPFDNEAISSATKNKYSPAAIGKSLDLIYKSI